MKVQIQLVTWNSAKDLPHFFESVSKQQEPVYEVVCIDNNSQDETQSILKKERVTTISLPKNTGFCHAHNIGFSKALLNQKIDAVLICNPDIILTPTCLQVLTKKMQSDKQIGTVSGVLLRQNQLTEGLKNGIIDSAGIEKKFGYRFTNRGEGKMFDKSFKVDAEVFANTGACFLISRVALQAIATNKSKTVEFFDETFFAYKEDVDLGWRVQKKQLKNICVGTVIGFHERHVKKTLGYMGKSSRIVELSYKNHLYLLRKHYRFINAPLESIGIIFYEFTKLSFLLLFRPKLLFKILRGGNSIL